MQPHQCQVQADITLSAIGEPEGHKEIESLEQNVMGEERKLAWWWVVEMEDRKRFT